VTMQKMMHASIRPCVLVLVGSTLCTKKTTSAHYFTGLKMHRTANPQNVQFDTNYKHNIQ